VAPRNGEQQFVLRDHCYPHPLRKALKVLHRLALSEQPVTMMDYGCSSVTAMILFHMVIVSSTPWRGTAFAEIAAQPPDLTISCNRQLARKLYAIIDKPTYRSIIGYSNL
jgi:hypothetical protein